MKKVLNTDINKLNWRFNQIFFTDHKPGHLLYVGIVGYADDLFLVSPTFDGLQKMLLICEKYASAHNLRFNTDSNPKKSKTNVLRFC